MNRKPASQLYLRDLQRRSVVQAGVCIQCDLSAGKGNKHASKRTRIKNWKGSKAERQAKERKKRGKK